MAKAVPLQGKERQFKSDLGYLEESSKGKDTHLPLREKSMRRSSGVHLVRRMKVRFLPPPRLSMVPIV